MKEAAYGKLTPTLLQLLPNIYLLHLLTLLSSHCFTLSSSCSFCPSLLLFPPPTASGLAAVLYCHLCIVSEGQVSCLRTRVQRPEDVEGSLDSVAHESCQGHVEGDT